MKCGPQAQSSAKKNFTQVILLEQTGFFKKMQILVSVHLQAE